MNERKIENEQIGDDLVICLTQKDIMNMKELQLRNYDDRDDVTYARTLHDIEHDGIKVESLATWKIFSFLLVKLFSSYTCGSKRTLLLLSVLL